MRFLPNACRGIGVLGQMTNDSLCLRCQQELFRLENAQSVSNSANVFRAIRKAKFRLSFNGFGNRTTFEASQCDPQTNRSAVQGVRFHALAFRPVVDSETEMDQLGPKSMDVPVIETDRLILRAHRLDDLPALSAMWGDPAVAQFIGGKPSTREECWARLLRYVGHWELLGFGYWAVQWKDRAGLIGDVGFANWERNIRPSLDGLPEGGWAFSTEAHGRGIATEAVNAALAWMDEKFRNKSTACIIGAENAASIRVAQKAGYQAYCRSEFKGSQVIQFRRKGAC